MATISPDGTRAGAATTVSDTFGIGGFDFVRESISHHRHLGGVRCGNAK